MSEPMPPLGLIPRFVRDHHRLLEIDAAIRRYVAALYPIPPEWQDEREEIIARAMERVINR